jgi:hypothetical protein
MHFGPCTPQLRSQAGPDAKCLVDSLDEESIKAKTKESLEYMGTQFRFGMASTQVSLNPTKYNGD